jgi:hypothetical protein
VDELLDLRGLHAAEHEHAAIGRISDRAGHHEFPGLLGLPDAGEMRLAMRGPALDDVLPAVFVEENVVWFLLWHFATRYAQCMADIQKRGSYTPRRTRMDRAYRLTVVGGIAGTVGVVGLVLAIVGVIGAGLPIIALIVAAICLVLFRATVSGP